MYLKTQKLEKTTFVAIEKKTIFSLSVFLFSTHLNCVLARKPHIVFTHAKANEAHHKVRNNMCVNLNRLKRLQKRKKQIRIFLIE